MKSVCTLDVFAAPSGSSTSALPREGQPCAVRDVARCVLVEERVEERHAELTDARRAVDECDLAEPLGAVVRLELQRTTSSPLTPSRRPRAAVEPRLEVLDHHAARPGPRSLVDRTVPSVRRASGAVKTSSVGMLGTWVRPSAVFSRAHPSRTPCGQPIVRSFPGPRIRSASKPRSVSEAARATSRSTCVLPGLHRIGSSRRTAFATFSQSRRRPARRTPSSPSLRLGTRRSSSSSAGPRRSP